MQFNREEKSFQQGFISLPEQENGGGTKSPSLDTQSGKNNFRSIINLNIDLDAKIIKHPEERSFIFEQDHD